MSMPAREAKKYLHDIIQAAGYITQFTSYLPKASFSKPGKPSRSDEEIVQRCVARVVAYRRDPGSQSSNHRLEINR